MPSYTFDKPNRLDKLMDELLTAIPALAPVGEGYNREAVFQLWAEGNQIHVDVKDGINVTEAEIAAVIDAHNTDPRPPSQQETDLAQVKAILTAAGNPTAAQIKQILKVYGKQLAILSKDD